MAIEMNAVVAKNIVIMIDLIIVVIIAIIVVIIVIIMVIIIVIVVIANTNHTMHVSLTQHRVYQATHGIKNRSCVILNNQNKKRK